MVVRSEGHGEGNLINDAKHWRARAEEVRGIAVGMADGGLRAAMQRIAAEA